MPFHHAFGDDARFGEPCTNEKEKRPVSYKNILRVQKANKNENSNETPVS